MERNEESSQPKNYKKNFSWLNLFPKIQNALSLKYLQYVHHSLYPQKVREIFKTSFSSIL